MRLLNTKDGLYGTPCTSSAQSRTISYSDQDKNGKLNGSIKYRPWVILPMPDCYWMSRKDVIILTLASSRHSTHWMLRPHSLNYAVSLTSSWQTHCIVMMEGNYIFSRELWYSWYMVYDFSAWLKIQSLVWASSLWDLAIFSSHRIATWQEREKESLRPSGSWSNLFFTVGHKTRCKGVMMLL